MKHFLKNVLLTVFGFFVLVCASCGTDAPLTSGGSGSTVSENDPNSPKKSFSQEVEQGSSLTVMGTLYTAEKDKVQCDTTMNKLTPDSKKIWKELADYKSLYGVQKTIGENERQLTLLLPRFKEEYTLKYHFVCADNSNEVVHEEHVLTAFHSYLPLMQGLSWEYQQSNVVDGLANSSLQKLIRSAKEEFLTFLNAQSDLLLRSYWSHGAAGLSRVFYQFRHNQVDYGVTLGFDPLLVYVHDYKSLKEEEREASSIVSLQVVPDHPNIQEYNQTKKLFVSTQKKDITIGAKTYSGFEITVKDADGKEVLPPRMLVKGIGAVQETMPKLFADVLGLATAPSYVVVEAGN